MRVLVLIVFSSMLCFAGYLLMTDKKAGVDIAMGSSATIINQTTVRFNGYVYPVDVVEYIDSTGNRCIIARINNEIELSCNYIGNK